VTSELAQGERDFTQGYYKKAMHRLLPLACDGNAQAQYAVGYMYYYGLGVAQDTDVGYFWISRSAQKHFLPAQEALNTIQKNRLTPNKK
jgi:TPR repeat protein